MENKVPKYSIGDIIKLNTDETFKREIICICKSFYDEMGHYDEMWDSKEFSYYTRYIDNDNYPPLPMKESSIDKYYSK